MAFNEIANGILQLKPMDSFGIWQKLKQFCVCVLLHDFIDLYKLLLLQNASIFKK